MKHRLNGISLWMSLIGCIPCMFANTHLEAAELHEETVKAWQQYVSAEERRMQHELASGNGFLALDFKKIKESSRERKELYSGMIAVDPIEPAAEGGKRISVPMGTIHHWRGTVFIPGVSLDHVLSRVENPDTGNSLQEDVLDSKVLEKRPGEIRLYLRLQRSRIVTAVYDTEHLVRIHRLGRGRASSSSIATRIVELERLNGKWSVEKQEGKDRGFLWRMNSYWRYQQVDGGVMVECESMTLSRSIPRFLAPVARPIINSIARESMQRTLQSMRDRMVEEGRSVTLAEGIETENARRRN